MNRILLCALFSLSVLTGFSQKDTSYFEVGVNTFRLVGVGKGLDAEDKKWLDPYMLNLEYRFGKVGLRASAGFSTSSSTELPSVFNGNAEFTNDTSSMDLRFGLVFGGSIHKNWSFKYGADFVYGSRERKFNSVVEDVDGVLVETESSNTYSETGFDVFVFPQFHLNARVSLATELSVRYVGNKTSVETISSEFEDFTTTVEKKGTAFSLRPPTSLYLIVRF